MRNFTAGKWEYSEYIPEGITINGQEYLIHSCGEDVALARREEEARLITAAPKMYELLGMAMQSLRHHSDNDGIIACRIGELLASIDGEESEQRRQNMSKFTPGKWEARPNRVIANGRPLAIVNGGNSANTRLMAAAPEMYELLQELAGTSAPGHYVEHFIELKDKARGLLTRIDGDSDVKTQESEP